MRILHVDDDEDVRLLAGLALRELGGLEVEQCSSGAAAIACAEEVRPDLLVLDLMMPQLDGVETLRRIRLLPGQKSVAAVFLTAKGSTISMDRLIELGVLGVIQKPFDPLTLAKRLNELWQSHPRS